MTAPGLNRHSPRLSHTQGNPIIGWIRGQRRPFRDILEHLAAVDAGLAQGLIESYQLRQSSRRLGLTLFIQYSQDQGLSAGEVAMLLGDAQGVVTEALNFLIGGALRESALAAVDDAVCCGEPVIDGGMSPSGFDEPELRPPVL